MRASVGAGAYARTGAVGSGQGIPYHPQGPVYRCSLPGLAGFTGVRRRGLDRHRRLSPAAFASPASREAHGLHVKRVLDAGDR